MGATSNESKQRCNREHYALVKAYVKHEIADALKQKCRWDDKSVSGRVGEMIAEDTYGRRKPKESCSATYSRKTRAMRRKAVAVAIGIIETVMEDEAGYMDNIPENLRNAEAYDAAERR